MHSFRDLGKLIFVDFARLTRTDTINLTKELLLVLMHWPIRFERSGFLPNLTDKHLIKLESLSFRDSYDILLEKRPSGVVELKYTMLYGKCQLKSSAFMDIRNQLI